MSERRRRWGALIAGIYLAGFPTYLATDALGLSGHAAKASRPGVFVAFWAWCVVAAVVGYLGLVDSRNLFHLLRTRQHLNIDPRQREAGMRAIELLILDAKLLKRFRPKVFVPDELDDPHELRPLLSRGSPAPEDCWSLKPEVEGIVGAVFADNDRDRAIVLVGAELATATSALADPRQRDAFASLQMVAAVVIQDVANRRVGVLSCSSTTTATGFKQRHVEELRLLAGELGALMHMVR